MSELIRDLGSQASGNEPNRWQAELAHVAIELIAVSTLIVHPFALNSQILLYLVFYFWVDEIALTLTDCDKLWACKYFSGY